MYSVNTETSNKPSISVPRYKSILYLSGGDFGFKHFQNQKNYATEVTFFANLSCDSVC